MKKFMAVIGTALAAILLTFGLFGCTKVAKVKVIPIDLTNEQYAFAIQKGNDDLMTAANELIDEILADGTMDALIEKYNSQDKIGFVKYSNPTKNPDLNTQLVVITNAEFPPFEMRDGEYFTGIDVEIAMKLAEKIGKPLFIKDGLFEAVINDVSVGYGHIGMAGLTITEDRKQSVNFSKPYYTDTSVDKPSQLLIVREGDTTFDDMTSVEQVVDKLKSFDRKTKIGFQKGTTGEFYVTTKQYIPEGLSVTAKGFDNGLGAIKDLSIGRINYVIIDKLPAYSLTASVNADIE